MPRPLPPDSRSSVLGAVLLVLLIPAAAPALTIKSVGVVVHPAKGDAFAIKGELDARDPAGLDLAAASRIVFELDGVTLGLSAADFKRTKTKLTFKGPSRTPGVSQLVIDLKKRRFAAKGSGLLVPPLPATFTARLRADDDVACALLPLERLGKPPTKPPTKPKAVKYGLPKKHPGSPCLLTGTLRAMPPAVTVATPTSLVFQASLAAGLVPDGGGAAVRRLDAGVPVDPPVCLLVDDGGAASGDLVAGDGLRACTATVTGPALGEQTFVAQATVGGTVVASAPIRIPVVPELTEADVTTLFAAQDAALRIWTEQRTLLDDSLNARLAALRAIAALPGVAEARLGANGLDIVIRYASGLQGGILLSARPSDTASVTQGAATRDEGGVAPPAGRAQPAGARAATCPPAPDRTLIGNRKAIILTTAYFPVTDDWPKAKTAFDDSCLPITTTVKQLTLASVLDVTSASALFFSTHGFLDDHGHVEIVTDQTATEMEAFDQTFADPTKRYETFVIGIPEELHGGGLNVWAFAPEYLRRIGGQFDKGFVYASQCHSAEDPVEAAVFRQKGARTFFGYVGSTSTTFARVVTGQLVPDIAEHLLTTGDAFARSVKIDPAPVKRLAPKGIRRVDLPPATFHMIGDSHLAYAGKPTVTPPTSSLENGEAVVLTPHVENTGDCELRHAWTSTTSAGLLKDGMGNEGGVFETVAPTVTYEADEEDVGTDAMSVSIRTDPDAPYLGTACASVEVRGCGDGKVNGDEECDGAADGACPGTCLSDCTCRQGPMCGNGVKEPGEICDGNDREICNALSAPRPGYCEPDCGGCGQCGDGKLDPNEECELTDDSPCPGGCRGDCTCGCAPGDPAGCGPTECCHPQLKTCCTPERIASDPECFATASSCCGNMGNLPPTFCGGPGGPSVCPDADCNDDTLYWCHYCDGKFMDGFCTFASCE
ncbi:MAG: hypothetical protein IT293_07220 [Deltaproteobacteria bacterium]|nr:hypothetical protein [Deltaproteobacteria bacterium]